MLHRCPAAQLTPSPHLCTSHCHGLGKPVTCVGRVLVRTVRVGILLPVKNPYPEDVGPSMPHARRVPPPSIKNAKFACGEVLVPGSDSGGPGTQSLSKEGSSPVGRWATPAASRGHESTSMTGCRCGP